MDSAAPGVAVGSESRPLVVVDVAGAKGRLCSVSSVSLCHHGQWRVYHTELSWAGDDPLSSRRALLSVAVTSVTWPR